MNLRDRRIVTHDHKPMGLAVQLVQESRNRAGMTFSESPVGKWLDCQWHFGGEGDCGVGDLALIQSLYPNGVIALCTDWDGEYVTVECSPHRIQLPGEMARVLPRAPEFPVGSKVRTVPGRSRIWPSVETKLVSTVISIGWHFKHSQFIYQLDGNPRRRRRAYLETQLTKES